MASQKLVLHDGRQKSNYSGIKDGQNIGGHKINEKTVLNKTEYTGRAQNYGFNWIFQCLSMIFRKFISTRIVCKL